MMSMQKLVSKRLNINSTSINFLAYYVHVFVYKGYTKQQCLCQVHPSNHFGVVYLFLN